MELLTITEVAKQLRLGRSTVYMMAQRGELPVVRFGTAVRIEASALDRWLERQINYPAELVGSEANKMTVSRTNLA